MTRYAFWTGSMIPISNVGSEREESEWDEEDSDEPFQESVHAFHECLGLYFQGFSILRELLLIQYSREAFDLLVILSPEGLFEPAIFIP